MLILLKVMCRATEIGRTGDNLVNEVHTQLLRAAVTRNSTLMAAGSFHYALVVLMTSWRDTDTRVQSHFNVTVDSPPYFSLQDLLRCGLIWWCDHPQPHQRLLMLLVLPPMGCRQTRPSISMAPNC
jgi:hypothetical protein